MKARSAPLLRNRVCVAACILLSSCSQKFPYKETAVPEPIMMSNRLQALFAKTKLVCFGRYAIQVPQEAELLMGEAWVPSPLQVDDGYANDLLDLANAKVEKIKRKSSTSEVLYNGTAGEPGTWQVRYFESKYHKEDGAMYFDTFVHRGDHIFSMGDAADDARSQSQTVERQISFAKSLRL